ncbi:XXYS1_4_G0027060.mRNA.1.CDS.1 [Saccharomyces cerevisiae]|nr:XXYS1_4_G0027060.mRNA.1.CDS.1 [Saccharomyces cerevisiae]CAI4648453.1 CEI_1a_G0042320.mRNA.1.CDS.1 [Saccharomyces cerevisiae]CAI7410747.1 CEI_1a_G0042320.mRNA.1.CDS.1 [Saccharomyces cerevisiae]
MCIIVKYSQCNLFFSGCVTMQTCLCMLFSIVVHFRLSSFVSVCGVRIMCNYINCSRFIHNIN